MIITDQLNSLPMPLDGYLYRDSFGVSSITTQTPTGVITSLSSCAGSCSCDSCNSENEVFAESAVTSDLRNDKFKFFGVALVDSGTVDFWLQKNGIDLIQITDESFGELLPSGTFATQLRLSTLFLNFQDVLSNYGEGTYSMRIETNILGGGVTSEFVGNFNLKIYTNTRAEGTTRFSWFQNGRILDNEIDFTGLNIEQQIRFKGNIGYNNTPELVTDEHETSSHNFEQIQDQVLYNYTFESEPLSFRSSNILLKDLILGNKIIVTSYNYFNHWVLTEKEVKASTIEEVKDFIFNKCAVIKIKFAERQRNTIKRNYF